MLPRMHFALYQYWRSSSSWRVRFALAHKKIEYESHAINLLDGQQSSSEHLSRNPMGFVPCLVIDGRPMTESVAIVELLDDLVPERPLLPKAPWDRARVRQLAEIINSGIQPLHNLGVLRKVASGPEEQRRWAQYWIGRGLGAFEALLTQIEAESGERRYCVGDELTMADIFLVPQVYQARRFGVDLESFRRTMQAHDRIASLEAAIASSPERALGAPNQSH